VKILVAGAGGQLGHDFCELLREKPVELLALNSRQMDLRQPRSVADQVMQSAPDWVVNCAAYTQVDRAEQEPELAFAVNRDGARALAQAAAAAGAWMLQLSTDFVFSGSRSEPYKEDDATGALGVYGQSKAEGESAVLEACANSVVLRTSWVYGAHGHNFVKTILRLAGERDELRVVSDQQGAPTWTRDLAQAMWRLMQQPQRGIFHFSNAGQASWYDFARAIVEEARALGFAIKAERIVPITTGEYPLPARRPAYSVLSSEKISPLLAETPRQWREGLQLMLEELKQCPDC
jgi:dTDP-4-dehydrorhamnose reductase